MICEKCMKLKTVEDNGEIFYCGLYIESKNAGLPVYSCAHFRALCDGKGKRCGDGN